MKTLTLIALMMPTMAFAGSNSDGQLAQRLQAQRQYDGGVTVRSVDKKYVDAAVAKLGGRATVEFGSKDQVSMGGVIVGSGADGLVSRANTQPGAPIVVRPPVTPRTSITVVGKSDDLAMYCAVTLQVDANGKVMQSSTFSGGLSNFSVYDIMEFRGETAKCGYLGQPLRLAPGKTLVTYNNSFYVVDLKPQQNLVIPLREVRVPKYNGEIRFKLYRDLRSSLEVSKILLQLKSDSTVDRAFNEESIERMLSATIPGQIDRSHVNPGSRNANIFFFMYRTQSTIQKSDGESILVLPGQYNIEWYIDGQKDYTTGIRVD